MAEVPPAGPPTTPTAPAANLVALQVLAGGIAHEFNNLLTTIQGYTDLARASLHAGTPHDYLGEVLAASRRAANLTRQLLAYAGNGHFVMRAVNLGELVAQMGLALSETVSRKARLVLDTTAATPPIRADAEQLRQVILQLAANASEALREGQGAITIRTGTRHEAGAAWACLEVSDDGVGMSDETRARVFEPFFSTRFTGRGLGLASALGIVRSHGGTIRVESELGRGSMFRVLLPKQEAPDEAAASAASTDRRRLLVVDDEDGVRNLAVLLLEQAGYEVVAACDGAEAMEKFRSSPEDFAGAVLDLTMPRMDGLELLSHLRGVRPRLPVVLMTGYSAVDLSRPADSPTVGLLQKPFTGSALVDAVRRAVGW